MLRNESLRRPAQACAALAALIGALVLQACPAPHPSSSPCPPADGARRIVSLAPSITESLLFISPDLAARLVGVTSFDDAPELKNTARVGGYSAFSSEAIAALRPDLILAEETSLTQARLDELARLGLCVRTLPLKTVSQTLEAIAEAGRLAGMTLEGERAARRLRENLAKSSQRAQPLERRPRAVVLIGWEPPTAAGPDTFAGEILTMAGADSALPSSPIPYPVLTAEALLALKLDLMVDAAHGPPGPAEAFLELARQAGSPPVHVRAGEALLRPGPHLAEASEMLSERIWEAFGPRTGGDPGPSTPPQQPPQKPDPSDR